MDKVSYALGVIIGNNIASSGLDNVDIASFSQAVGDVINKGELSMTVTEANDIVNDYFAKLQSERFEKNVKEGKEFLEANKAKSGVVTLPSGLQYEILQKGEGKTPTLTDQVTCHYHGTLIDGTVFDSSIQRGTPATFGVNQVIKGWTEALQLMPVGSKWRLYIPSDLAYGESGAGQAIEPYSTLIFDVEILDIV